MVYLNANSVTERDEVILHVLSGVVAPKTPHAQVFIEEPRLTLLNAAYAYVLELGFLLDEEGCRPSGIRIHKVSNVGVSVNTGDERA